MENNSAMSQLHESRGLLEKILVVQPIKFPAYFEREFLVSWSWSPALVTSRQLPQSLFLKQSALLGAFEKELRTSNVRMFVCFATGSNRTEFYAFLCFGEFY